MKQSTRLQYRGLLAPRQHSIILFLAMRVRPGSGRSPMAIEQWNLSLTSLVDKIVVAIQCTVSRYDVRTSITVSVLPHMKYSFAQPICSIQGQAHLRLFPLV